MLYYLTAKNMYLDTFIEAHDTRISQIEFITSTHRNWPLNMINESLKRPLFTQHHIRVSSIQIFHALSKISVFLKILQNFPCTELNFWKRQVLMQWVWKTKRRSRTGNLRHFTCATGEPCANTSARNVLWRVMTWKFVQKQLLFLWTDISEPYDSRMKHTFYISAICFGFAILVIFIMCSHRILAFSCHMMHVKIMSSVNAPLHTNVNCFLRPFIVALLTTLGFVQLASTGAVHACPTAAGHYG